MKEPVNLTPLQKDYAVYLPAISSFYSTYVAKQRLEEFVPKDRIPAGFDRGIEGMNFLNPEQGYFYYKNGEFKTLRGLSVVSIISIGICSIIPFWIKVKSFLRR